MEVIATSRWVRVTARKARLVANSVTGMPVSEALALLAFSPRGVASDVAKVIRSAAANAEHNYNLDTSTLRVSRVEVDGAMIIKRFRPKPRGMAGSIFKRTSHLRAFVTDAEAGPERRRGPIRGVSRGFDRGRATGRAPVMPVAPVPAEAASKAAAAPAKAARKPAGKAAAAKPVETKPDAAKPAAAKASATRPAATKPAATKPSATKPAAKPAGTAEKKPTGKSRPGTEKSSGSAAGGEPGESGTPPSGVGGEDAG